MAAVIDAGGVPARTAAAGAMDAAEAFLARFVCFPTEHTRVAATLWVAHTYLLERFDSTPRIAFLSPEPGSGKTRALEVIGSMVRRPIHAVHCTPAALFRAVGDTEHRPTILFDEADTVFGPRARDNEEIRGFLNAGHRRSGTALRCVGMGTQQRVVEFPSFAAVALAGLHDLPGTIASRAVIVRMRRRAPGEFVEPYRQRLHEPQGLALGEHLAEVLGPLHIPEEPQLPTGVTDRPADVWEPLLGIAQTVGNGWAERAADACLALVTGADPSEQSLSLLLLTDLRRVFTAAGKPDELPTAGILAGLHAIEESPWRDLRGRPLDPSALARRLRGYEVRPVNLRVGDAVVKGYRKADLHDPWQRYLPVELDSEPVGGAPSPQMPLQPLQPLQPTPSHAHLVLGEGPFEGSSL